ncbi:MAG: hypothetical protein V1809_05535 [Planctomycetota bacterium]
MEPLDLVETLAEAARNERAPAMNIRQNVLLKIRRPRPVTLIPFWIYAGCLTPAAAAVMFVTIRIWTSLYSWMSSAYWTGPLDNFISPLRLVMP